MYLNLAIAIVALGSSLKTVDAVSNGGLGQKAKLSTSSLRSRDVNPDVLRRAEKNLPTTKTDAEAGEVDLPRTGAGADAGPEHVDPILPLAENKIEDTTGEQLDGGSVPPGRDLERVLGVASPTGDEGGGVGEDDVRVTPSTQDAIENIFVTVDPIDNKNTSCDIFSANTAEPCMAKMKIQMKFGAPGAGMKVVNAEMSLRGKASLLAEYKSFNIVLNDNNEAPQGLWHGQRHLNLNKHHFDMSKIRNKLSFDLLASLPNLHSSRTRFVKLFVDRRTGKGYEEYGLFTHVEQLDKLFFKSRSLDPDGDLYAAEMFEFQRYPNELKAVDDPTYDRNAFEKHLLILNGGKDHTALLSMLDSVNDELQDFDKVFKKYFDEDNFLEWLAANVLLDNVDTMTQNFSLFRPTASSIFYFLPWDYDGAFDFTNQRQRQTRFFRPRYRSGIATWWNSKLIQRFLKQEGAVERLTAKIYELLTKQISPSRVKAFMDSYIDYVRPLLCCGGELTTLEWENEIARFPGLINTKYLDFLHSLERPMPIFLGAELIDSVVEFRWTPSYHLRGRNITYDIEIATTPTFDSQSVVMGQTGLLDTYSHVEHLSELPTGDNYFRVTIRDVYKPKDNWQFGFDLLDGKYDGTIKFVVPPKTDSEKVANDVAIDTYHPHHQRPNVGLSQTTVNRNLEISSKLERVANEVVVPTTTDPEEKVSKDVSIDASSSVKSNEPVHIILLSDRARGAAVTLSSVCASTKLSNDDLVFHFFGDNIANIQELTDGIPSCAGASFDLQSVSDATEELLAQGFRPFWADKAVPEESGPEAWGVTTPYTHDKHASALNLLRFYLPYLSSFRNVKRIVFLDDDIIIQRDISELLQVQAEPGKALLAGCQHWVWSSEDGGRFKSSYDQSVRETGYLGNIGSICDDDEHEDSNVKNCVRDGFEQEIEALSLALDAHDFPRFAGRPLERQAFNMGLNVIQTDDWKAAHLSHRFEQVVEANIRNRIFPPDTLGFGLGLGYFAIGDAFQCYDSQISHIVGLSFIDQDVLDKEGFTLNMLLNDGFALHFNGPNKPWEKSHDHMCKMGSDISQTGDIWQRACINAKFCDCGDVPSRLDKDKSKNGSSERGLRKRPNVGLSQTTVNRNLEISSKLERVANEVVVPTTTDPEEKVSKDVSIDASSSVKSNEPVHIILLSDRARGAAVTLSSVCASTKLSNDDLVFHFFGDNIANIQELTDGIPSCAGASFDLQSVSDATEELLAQGFRPFWADKAVPEESGPEAWGVTTPYTHDKHASALNLLRFYLPYLSSFRNVKRIVFLDDDIIIQRDISELLQVQAEPGKALLAGCQHWVWSSEDGGRFKSSYDQSVRETGYLGNIGSICDDDEHEDSNVKNCVRDGFEQEIEALSLALDAHDFPRFAGRPLERQAFNMGLNVIQTDDWKAAHLSHRFEQVVEANIRNRIFPPDTLGFGLGLGYFAIGDAFQCYDSQISHIVGLSFIDQDVLDKEGFTLNMLLNDGFALHFNGPNKPWEKSHDHMCKMGSDISQTGDIWQRACINAKFCDCGDVPSRLDKDKSKNGSSERGLRKRPNVGLSQTTVNRNLEISSKLERVANEVVVPTTTDPEEKVSKDVSIDASSSVKSNEPVHIILLSDRARGAAVTLSSVCASTKLSNDDLVFHFFGDNIANIQELTDGIPSCAGASFDLQSVSDATEELLAQGFRPFWADKAVPEESGPEAWGVTTPYTHDKHASALNLLRFYLPYLSSFRNVKRIVFLDDDIIIQRDISELLQVQAEPGKALLAGCQHWVWSSEDGGRFKSSYDQSVRETGYLGNIGSICDDDEHEDSNVKNCVRDGFEQEIEALSLALDAHDFPRFAGRPLERQAFNMGLNVIQTDDWKAAHLSHRFEQVVEANIRNRIFPPDTLGFGLGLGYFAIGDAFQCYDSQISHIVGLSFIDQDVLDKEGFTLNMLLNDGFALHFNGPNKPWEKSHDHMCKMGSDISQTGDIWQRACINAKFCDCGDVPSRLDKDKSKNGSSERGLRKLERVANEVVVPAKTAPEEKVANDASGPESTHRALRGHKRKYVYRSTNSSSRSKSKLKNTFKPINSSSTIRSKSKPSAGLSLSPLSAPSSDPSSEPSSLPSVERKNVFKFTDSSFRNRNPKSSRAPGNEYIPFKK